ncbi:parB-like partition protein [Desulfovibrio sp. X2]|uniref:ParB/RepB/Spo0J family partition protein n=1 Tax=Desulfovibrio sp. X2 TaxID=941449 RepID=UPI000358F28B|nr:ParB/RepB/Spo0J family partition protein [Desulfovibrio sp. X2]EPR44008.1 parB-like partition protein [Desulfovibrio sp. X2]
MPEPSRGLGRGLDALLGGVAQEAGAAEVRRLPITSIIPNPQQPRRTFDQEGLKDLARSIKSQGVLQPVLVRRIPGRKDEYELVAGERRWRASQMAGMTDIPAMIKNLDDEESLAIALIENLQREDLNPIEEARGLRELQERLSLSQEELAGRVGKSRPAVANALRLLTLPESVQDDLLKGGLTAGHARAILAIADQAAQVTLMERIGQLGLSVRQAEAQATYWKKNGDLPEEGAVVRIGAGRRKGPGREKSPSLDDMAQELAGRFGVKVTCTGQEERGRISFYFTSKEELEGLLRRFGE